LSRIVAIRGTPGNCIRLREARLAEYESSIRAQLAAANRLLNDLYEQQPDVIEKHHRAEEDLRAAKEKVRRKEAELEDAERKLSGIREHLSSSASERARSVLGTAAR
jgi:chromosome segregation ATPase